MQQAYIDGMVEEEILTFEPVTSADPVMSTDDDLRRMGLRVIDGGRV